ncbi:hypothetical protein HPB48_011613 [Haemaphysalis longicornis]|uniref:Uncharacterized protein n=1 Tax=Haemaphysalis longicornis TaxID=44386 RepID=A0A9J6GEP0_HAELO|nr:hypothetical protein HPB48_011613 [Haemaphysalis longicornis]
MPGYADPEALQGHDVYGPLCQEVLCNEHQCPHQATVDELKRKLDLQQKKTRKLEQQVESVLGSKLHHLAPDQVLSATNSDARGNRWSNKAVQKAL